MTYHVVLTLQAQCELEDCANWWAEHRSLSQAARWYEGFSAALQSLERNPQHHAKSAENRRFPHEIRDLHYGLGPHSTHRAVFTIRDDIVLVLTIRHVAQDELRSDDVTPQ